MHSVRRCSSWVLACTVLATPALAMATRDPALDKILEDVKVAFTQQQQPMVIFDLDGTLFDNRPRILKILQEYGEQELKGVRPEAAQALAALKVDQIKYLLTETLNGVGVTEAAVVNNAAVFWSQRFFADEYLKYDIPTAGSVSFVRALYSNGARIVYLSGRDAPRQLLGTVQALRDQGYPVGIQGTEIIMKPTAQTQDAIFKQQVTNYLRHYGRVVATFDNEPANANVYKRAFQNATCVLYSAPHSPNPPALLTGITPVAAFE